LGGGGPPQYSFVPLGSQSGVRFHAISDNGMYIAGTAGRAAVWERVGPGWQRTFLPYPTNDACDWDSLCECYRRSPVAYDVNNSGKVAGAALDWVEEGVPLEARGAVWIKVPSGGWELEYLMAGSPPYCWRGEYLAVGNSGRIVGYCAPETPAPLPPPGERAVSAVSPPYIDAWCASPGGLWPYFAAATAINDWDAVCGYVRDGMPITYEQAFVCLLDGTTYHIGTDFPQLRPLGLNNAGQVVGVWWHLNPEDPYDPNSWAPSPFLWDAVTGLQRLPIPDPNSWAGVKACAINDHGIIVGIAGYDTTCPAAVLWHQGSAYWLGDLVVPATFINAGHIDINNLGWIVGYTTDCNASTYPFLLVPICRGDANCDGEVSFADLGNFLDALSGESAWTHWPCPWLNADCNGDGTVTYADIGPFVSLIGTACP